MSGNGGDDFWTWSVWTPILITLVSGTVSSLANKVVYDTKIQGKDSCGEPSKFEKAYFFTLLMFLGEMCCLFIYWGKTWWNKRQQSQPDSYYSLGNGGARDVSPRLAAVQNGAFNTVAAETAPVAGKKPPVWTYAVLCCFDLSATTIAGIGLIWVDVSTNQMLRGSMVVFCAIFSVLMLKRKLSNKQWSAIGLVCVGLVLVGASGMLKKKYDPSPDDDSASVSSSQLLIGIMLVLLGSALNAVQNVFEEKLLKAVGAAEVDPLELVGWEGFFGSCLAAFVMLPIVYWIPGSDCGSAEDSLNTLVQLGHSPMAICLCLSFVFGLCLMNWTSQQISQKLSAVHRNLVSAVRTVLVWIGALILYYTTKNDSTVYGEPWTVWSLMELAGFLVLVAGTILYSYFGLQLAAEQASLDKYMVDTVASPEYMTGVDPTMGERSHIVHQKSKSDLRNGAIAHSYGRDDVYDASA